MPLSPFVPCLRAVAALMALAACTPPAARRSAALDWAYPSTAAPGPLPATSPGLHRVPGSALAFTGAQVDDEENPPDWRPHDHPPAPAIVAHGRPSGPTPCAECHLFNGEGYLGAASLVGLSPTYIAQQIGEFRTGRRTSWQRRRPDTLEMAKVAGKVTGEEVAQAAGYFSALKRRPWVRVVEAGRVPATRPDWYGWLDLVPNSGLQPIGHRIVEVPEDAARTVLEDPGSGVIDYVPPGAVRRGETLARTGGASGLPCAGCHGASLRGQGDTPPLAGRAAAYQARMLWDIKTGARKGPAVAPMQAPAAGLSEADITDIVAYLASLPP